MRRLASLLFIGLFVTVPHLQALAFTDTTGTPYQTAFAELSADDIVHGYSDGQGRPYGMLRRSEAVKVLMNAQDDTKRRAAQLANRTQPINLFSDVPSNEWFRPFVEAAFERGIVQGYPNGTFQPGRLLTVEEAITLLMRTYNISDASYQQSAYMENRPNEWFSGSVSAAVQRNLIAHHESLRLGTAITRGQFFEMVYRIRELRERQIASFPEPTQPVLVAQNFQNQTVPTGPTITQLNFNTSGSTNTSGANSGVGGGNVYSSGSNNTTNTSSTTTQTTTTTTTQPTVTHTDLGAGERTFSISIPAAGIENLLVTHPTDPFSSEGMLAPLQSGVGHLFSYPGGGGKIMIYGHSSGYPWDVSEYTKIFRQINVLEPGDKIYVDYAGERYTYEVSFEETVPAADTSRFDDNGSGEELILYTCWPPDSITQRYLVHARPI